MNNAIKRAAKTSNSGENKGENNMEEEELGRENRVLIQKIGDLERKIGELENYCRTLENRPKEESALALQIKEKVDILLEAQRWSCFKKNFDFLE